jgi:hypothetical protein
MTVQFTGWVIFSQLAFSPLPVEDMQISGDTLTERCQEVAERAILGAIRLIGRPNYQENRELLVALNCHRSPTAKRSICMRLYAHAAQIGSQGSPGHKRIRQLIGIMECHRTKGSDLPASGSPRQHGPAPAHWHR